MIRNIAGIMADEEPKTPVSPSGLYNSSSLATVGAQTINLSSPSLSGLSEFTFMAWYYLDPVDINNFNVSGYSETPKTSFPIIIEDNRIRISMVNSNLGTTSCIYNTVTPVGEWIFICVTGSVLNGVCKIFLNGELKQSATMTYSNYSYSNAKINDTQESDIAQLNIYNRELTEAEVAEHYVYDDDTMTSGVLGFDAMNPAQKSGLIYSSSFIEDVSIAGGEFNDKSGSNITLSPQPSLTGEQIYVYTDANDLPSDTTIYPVNSANLNGSSQYFIASSDSNNDVTTGNFSISIWIKSTSSSGSRRIVCKSNPSVVNQGFDMYHNSSGELRLLIGSSISDYRVSSTTGLGIDDSTWHHVLMYSNIGSPAIIYVDGSLVPTSYSSTSGVVTTLTNNGTYTVGRRSNATSEWLGELAFEEFSYGDLTPYITELYGNGTPPCPSDYSTDLKDTINEGHPLCNWNGNTGDELVGYKGSFNLTNNGSTPFTGTGLSVECGGSPTPSNALPSNLPTIL